MRRVKRRFLLERGWTENESCQNSASLHISSSILGKHVERISVSLISVFIFKKCGPIPCLVPVFDNFFGVFIRLTFDPLYLEGRLAQLVDNQLTPGLPLVSGVQERAYA